MPEYGIWAPQEIADELGMSRQFVIDVITGKIKKYSLPAKKKGHFWFVTDTDAKAFIQEVRSPSVKEKLEYSPNDIAKAINKSRKYVLDALTGYSGRKSPRLAGEKRGDRWIVSKEEAERFIGEHVKEIAEA
jgi:hypothetical protein